jgi:hypothetical protein
VIIARTFSKIAALAAMRIGYAVAPAELGSEDAPVLDGQRQRRARIRRGGGAQGHRVAGRDQEADDRRCARRPPPSSRRYGYETIPSETNFFMVSIGREIQPVIQNSCRRRCRRPPFPR